MWSIVFARMCTVLCLARFNVYQCKWDKSALKLALLLGIIDTRDFFTFSKLWVRAFLLKRLFAIVLIRLLWVVVSCTYWRVRG